MVNTVVATRDGGIATCDIPVSADLEQFNQDYLKLTGQVWESGESYELGGIPAAEFLERLQRKIQKL